MSPLDCAESETILIQERETELLHQHQQLLYRRTDRMFAVLMSIQWVAAVAAAAWISPLTWEGLESRIHVHVWMAILMGGVLTSLPVLLAIRRPGHRTTRHAIAISQVLFSALLIHITGGRPETHFHVFGSLAFLAVYRDWKVLIPATLIAAADHFLRGIYWPQSVFGTLAYGNWRWLEHAGWVLFEDAFLLISIRSSAKEMKEMSHQTAELESSKRSIERIVDQRTIELKEMERTAEAAQAASRAKSQFLANMSHEIRTPMNGVIGLTELLLQTELTSDQRRQLELVQSSANSLMSVLNDILDFSKIESGKFTLDTDVFDLRDLVGDTLKMFGLSAHQKGLELGYRVRPDVPSLAVNDAARLRQVLVNLIGNALKFTEHGEIFVGVEVEEQNRADVVLKFTVDDTGIGIAPDKMKEIFEPFVQADGSTTRKYGGTGLGLTITNRLVEMMGGRIWIESDVGKGSHFMFTVRCGLPDHVPERSTPATWCASFEGLRVLIVDDNSTNRLILDEMLRNWRMKPTVVANGLLALEALENAEKSGESYSLVLLDAHMPEIDGFEVAERIQKKLGANRPTLMMLSSADSDDSYDRCRELGIASYLVKPLKQSELLEQLVNVLHDSMPDQIQRVALDTPAKPAAPVQPLRSLRVLLAEDNFVNQQLMIRILEKQGHKVQIANNGAEACKLVERQVFDIILMDVQMPEMDGIQATAKIRQLEKRKLISTPIIALTAHAMKGDKEKCLDAGMDAYVSKPIQATELYAVMAELVKKDLPETTTTTTNVVATVIEPAADVLDRDDVMKRLDGDLEFLEQMTQLFQADYPNHLSEIESALKERSADRIRKAAHTLKGLAGNLGGKKAANVAMSVETLARESRLDDCPKVVAQLETSLVELHTALNALIKA